MATFAYVDVPADAIRLKQSVCEPATKIRTELPAEIQKPNEPRSTLTLVPQMLLAASPTSAIVASTIVSPNPRQALLSTRDPLSVQILTANFRRFVSKVGPVFWLQDRIEEIVLWKKGWKHTAVWIAAYAFFCYFPRMALLIPHIVLLGLMLYYYPDPGAPQAQINLGEATADWQANIQAIQNLMGAFSDAYDAIVPLLPFLLAPQSPPPPPPPPSKSHSMFAPTPSHDPLPKLSRHPSETPSPAIHPPTQPHHPLLIATILSFLALLPLLMTDILPLRLLFFLAGAGTVIALHPRIRGPLSSAVLPALSGTGPGLSLSLSVHPPRLPRLPFPFVHQRNAAPSPSRAHTFAFTIAPRDVYLFFRRMVDDDRLEDAVWRAPLAHVELWENERWVSDTAEGRRQKSVVVSYMRDDDDGRDDDRMASMMSAAADGGAAGAGAGSAATTTATGTGTGTGGTWSKTHLRPTERVGWTRGRDGWSGVGGQVSSNLTFSLSPGWVFVETESWRTDLVASWAVPEDEPDAARTGARMSVCVGADQNGWTYTTDTWTHPRPDGRPGDGWVTRRRRWVRRVYFKGDE